ncbi:MAG TPA: TIGR03943 family protein [bacterium]|nr:TIGR03943 family protein [bacterium]HOM25994.1 TIGR03943 family protein [bacterium]
MKIFKNRQFYEFLIIIFYILFFISLIFTGNFKIFVKNFYFPYIVIGVLILVFLLTIEIKKMKNFKQLNVYDIFSFIIFLFPLILFILVRPTALPTYAALKRGIQTEFLSKDILKSLQEKIETEGKYKKLTIKQLLALSKSKPEEIEEKDVSIEGMVYKGEEKEKFTLIRFLITCCAADATPLGVEVEYKGIKEKSTGEWIPPEEKEEFKNEDWVNVKGKVKIEEGKVKIIAEEVKKTNPPSDPYLY